MKTIQTEPGLKHSAREGSVFSSMDNMPTFYCELERTFLSLVKLICGGIIILIFLNTSETNALLIAIFGGCNKSGLGLVVRRTSCKPGTVERV